MKYRGKNIFNTTLIAASIFAMLLFVGCGDNELAKGITDVVKKSVDGEITKKVGDLKKQFDQVINLGGGKGQKENGQGGAGDGKSKSEKGSGRESEDEKD